MSHNAKRHYWAPTTSQVVASSRGDIGELDIVDPSLLELIVWCQQMINKQMNVQVGIKMSHERNKRFSGKAVGWQTWSQSAEETGSPDFVATEHDHGAVFWPSASTKLLKIPFARELPSSLIKTANPFWESSFDVLM